jgi:hypothetical protein
MSSMSLITINGAPVGSHMQMSSEDLCYIFYAVRSSMVNDRPKPGIFKKLAYQLSYDSKTIWGQWKKMKKKLAILLSNQPEEDHIGIIAAGSHILFATDAIRIPEKSKSAETFETLIVDISGDSDVDISDGEADEILAILRGTANNSDLYDNGSSNTDQEASTNDDDRN